MENETLGRAGILLGCSRDSAADEIRYTLKHGRSTFRTERSENELAIRYIRARNDLRHRCGVPCGNLVRILKESWPRRILLPDGAWILLLHHSGGMRERAKARAAGNRSWLRARGTAFPALNPHALAPPSRAPRIASAVRHLCFGAQGWICPPHGHLLGVRSIKKSDPYRGRADGEALIGVTDS